MQEFNLTWRRLAAIPDINAVINDPDKAVTMFYRERCPCVGGRLFGCLFVWLVGWLIGDPSSTSTGQAVHVGCSSEDHSMQHFSTHASATHLCHHVAE
jgi:hypothetical protein